VDYVQHCYKLGTTVSLQKAFKPFFVNVVSIGLWLPICCGIFAIAVMASLAHREDSSFITYDQNKMKKHVFLTRCRACTWVIEIGLTKTVSVCLSTDPHEQAVFEILKISLY